MPWGPEDWDALLIDKPIEHSSLYQHDQVVREILHKVPRREEKTIADLGCGSGTRLPFLAASFGRVVAIDRSASKLAQAKQNYGEMGVFFAHCQFQRLAIFSGRFDALIALDSLNDSTVADISGILPRIRASLIEGGIFIASLPGAVLAAGNRPEMRLGAEQREATARPIHELELQYQLHRAGFQGVRIRRFDLQVDGSARLLCMAVRRANN